MNEWVSKRVMSSVYLQVEYSSVLQYPIRHTIYLIIYLNAYSLIYALLKIWQVELNKTILSLEYNFQLRVLASFCTKKDKWY